MTTNQPPENPENEVPQTPAGPPQTPPPAAGPIGQPQTPPPAAGPIGPAFSVDQPHLQPDQPQAGGYPPSAFGAPPPPAPKKKSVLKRSLITIVGVVVAIVVGVLVRSGAFDSPSMKVGDCVQQVGEDDVKVVDCQSTDAQYSILGIVEKQSQISARMGACTDFPDTTSVYWQGRNTNSGTVYCLKRL